MIWYKGDDTFLEWPEVLALQQTEHFLSALGLYYACAIWCSKRLTDGVVPAKVVRGFTRSKVLVQVLVQVQLWSEHSQGSSQGYRFVHWARNQPLREKVEKSKELTNQRVRRFRTPGSNADGNAECNADSNAGCNGGSNALCNVARPVPGSRSSDPKRVPRSGSGERARDFPDPGENENARLASQIGQVLAGRFPVNPGAYSRQQVALLALWLATNHPAEPVAVAERLAEAFAADEWAQLHGYPIADLANRPERYLRGHSGTIELKEAEARELLKAGDLDGYRAVAAELTKLRANGGNHG